MNSLATVFSNKGCWSALLLRGSSQASGQAGFPSSAWSPASCCFSVCPPGVSVALCCFTLTRWTDRPRLSARSYFAPRLWLLIVFLISLPTPNILFGSNHLSLYINPFLSSRHLCLPSVTCVSLLLCHTTPPPLRPLPCCAVHRSEQDRWSQRISGLCSFLQGTAWYCCCHDALSGCLQVPELNSLVLSVTSRCKRDNDSAPAHTLLCVIPSLLYSLTSL